MYWHCRTFNVTPYRSLMKAANPLPSQIPLAIPTDSGGCRKIDLISFSCSSFTDEGGRYVLLPLTRLSLFPRSGGPSIPPFAVSLPADG